MPQVAVRILERPREWGVHGSVHRICGYPCNGSRGCLGALEDAGDDLFFSFFVQTGREEMAAFMASASLDHQVTAVVRGDETATAIASKGLDGEWSELAARAEDLVPGARGGPR